MRLKLTKMRLVPLLALSLLWLPTGAELVSDTFSINFRQSRTELDPSYMSNPAALVSIDSLLSLRAAPDSGYVLKKVRVGGAASPEGSVKFNEWLSRRRAERIFGYVSNKVALPDSLTEFRYAGPDWEGLLKMAGNDSGLPERDATLDLIGRIAVKEGGAAGVARNTSRLKSMKNGTVYRYLFRKFYPTLRASSVTLEYERPEYPAPVPEEQVARLAEIVTVHDTIIVRDTVYVEVPVAYCPCRPFYMDVKTNMLLDLLAIPNVGVEFYLGKGWTVGGQWAYGWWKSDRRHRYWRAYGGELNVRKWFGRASEEKPLTGHHLGLNVSLFTYDFEFGGKGYMGGYPGKNIFHSPSWGAGIEYGYSLPVAKRLNIDFTVGIGWLTGLVREYEPEEGCYMWTKTKRVNWVGPTKAAVSLVWLIGCDNYNRKKGGSK